MWILGPAPGVPSVQPLFVGFGNETKLSLCGSLDILISRSALVEPGWKKPKEYLIYSAIPVSNSRIWISRHLESTLEASLVGCLFQQNMLRLLISPNSWVCKYCTNKLAWPKCGWAHPTMTLIHIPQLVVILRCNSDYALLCWKTTWLIVDLKCTVLTVDEDFYTNPAYPSFLNIFLPTQYFFGLLELLAVPWGCYSLMLFPTFPEMPVLLVNACPHFMDMHTCLSLII